MLWRAISDQAQAKKHTLAGCEWAWSDGKPYVKRYELNRAAELLCEMKIPPPDLPPYGR